MTAIKKSYRFRVHDAGTTTPTDLTVDWSETTRIAEVGQIGGQVVHPLRGRTSARPWTVTLVDVDEVITARLADSDGRAQLLRRLADLSVSTDDGSTWTVKQTARIDDVAIDGDDLSAVRFTMQDERLIERKTTIFKGGNSTRLLPPGLDAAWLDYQGARPASFQVIDVNAGNDTTELIYRGDLGNPDGDTFFRVADAIIQLMEDDVVDDPAPNQGNFETLRIHIEGTDYVPSAFNGSPATDPLKNVRDRGTLMHVTVAGYEDPGWPIKFTRLAYFHMKSRDPSGDLPLHLGTQEGVDPFQLAKDIYDGTYQDATWPATVRYDSTVFSAYDPSTNPNGLIDNPRFPKMHFRITGPANMARWLEDHIYGPLGVVPFINAAGEVSPRIVTQPASDQIADPDNLPQLTPANVASPHPAWRNAGREIVTVVEYTFEYAVAPSYRVQLSQDPNNPASGLFGSLFGRGVRITPTEGGQDVGFDLLQSKSVVLTREIDRAQHHRDVHEVTVRGIHRVASRKSFADKFGRDLLDRFGDGPVYVENLVGLSDSESRIEGEWVMVDMDTLPSLQNQSRSGSRIVQIIERVDEPGGPIFKLLEAGPHSQPLSTPSISLAASSNDPENAVDVTISGLGTGEGYEVHLTVGATEPDEEDPDWQYRHLSGSQNETVTVRRLPAGSTIWARVRATAPGRISSDWSTADSQATTAYTAPSALADSGVAGDVATISWTNGEADRDIVVTLDGAFVDRLPAGTEEYTFYGLDTSTSYTAGVKHVDDYGGESSLTTDGFTTTASPSLMQEPFQVRLMVGAAA